MRVIVFDADDRIIAVGKEVDNATQLAWAANIALQGTGLTAGAMDSEVFVKPYNFRLSGFLAALDIMGRTRNARNHDDMVAELSGCRTRDDVASVLQWHGWPMTLAETIAAYIGV